MSFANSSKELDQAVEFFAVPKVGVEPTLPEENYALNVARLPIPPLRLESELQYTCSAVNVNTAIFPGQGNRFNLFHHRGTEVGTAKSC